MKDSEYLLEEGEVMKPITIEEFVQRSIELNPDVDREQLQAKLRAAVSHKKAGARCMNCGKPIWAIGTAICGWDACFPCVTGTANDLDDYEIDGVCWSSIV